MRTRLAALGLTLLGLSPSLALTQESGPAAPKTKLERFVAQDGAVIVRGFSTIGTLRAKYRGTITVDSKEFANVALDKSAYGITIEVKEASSYERKHTSFVDYEEIDSLLDGLDYIAKVDKSVTQLDNFQADYRTRGDLVFSTFSTEGTIEDAVSSGTIGKTDAFIELGDLAKLREMIATAKAKLDEIRQ